MKSRIVIPTDDKNATEIAEHFGRAPFFAVIDLEEGGSTIEMNVQPNTEEHSGGKGHAQDNVLQYNPKAIIVQGMGPRGIMSFQSQNIAVLRANSRSISELVHAFSHHELEELTEGCIDAHHK